MAKRATASPAPASAPAPRRATRSQSREPQAATQPAEKSTRASSAQRELANSAFNGLQAMLAGGDYIRTLAQNLDTVPEEPGQTIGVLNDVGRANNGRDNRYKRLESIDRFSQITRNTTFSQDEIQGLDADIIIGQLRLFHAVASNILKAVAPINAAPDELEQLVYKLLDNQSSLRKGLKGRLDAFNALQVNFGQQTFVNPEHILRFLLELPADEEVLSHVWRPDDIFYLTNLVDLLQLIFQDQDAASSIDTLEPLDNRFPAFALAELVPKGVFGGVVGESNLVIEAQSVAIDFRTQLFIAALQQVAAVGDEADSADVVLAQVFLWEPEDEEVAFPETVDATHLRPWEPLLTAADNDFEKMAIDRIMALKEIIDRCDNNVALSLSHLVSQYSWPSFCYNVLQWVQARQGEVQQLIDGRGGVEVIVDALEREVKAVNEDSQEQSSTLGTPAGARRSLANRANIEALKARRMRTSGQVPDGTSAPTDNDGFVELPEDDEVLVQPDVQQSSLQRPDSTRTLADRLRMVREPAANKENRPGRLLDPQAGAHRVTFDSQEPSSTSRVPASSAAAGRQSASRKRPFVEDDDEDMDPTQDEGFQTDTRTHAVPQRRPQRPPQANMTISPARRNVLPRTSNARNVTDTQAARERQNPGQALDMGTAGDEPLAGSYAAVNRTARVKSRNAVKPQKERRKWTQEEDEHLIAMIAEKGPSYSIIKKDDADHENVFGGRTAEDLRFKARNMKVDYCLSGVDLPEGFDAVYLGKKEKERLDKNGVPYEQVSMRGGE